MDSDSTAFPFAPNRQFNALSEEEKKKLLSSGLGAAILGSGLPFAVPLWWFSVDSNNIAGLRNGSACLVDLGQGVFVATAAHVFREYVNTKRTVPKIACQLGSLLFDPEARLMACSDALDLATFHVEFEEVVQLGKPVATLGPPGWEPLSPLVGNFAFFAGFPAQTRGLVADGSFLTAPYYAMPAITSVTDHQIGCRFDREKSLDFSGSGLPPVGYDIGGVSGGPMLIPTLVRQDGIEGVVWRFAGIVVQAAAGNLFEQVVAVRAHYLNCDGGIG